MNGNIIFYTATDENSYIGDNFKTISNSNTSLPVYKVYKKKYNYDNNISYSSKWKHRKNTESDIHPIELNNRRLRREVSVQQLSKNIQHLSKEQSQHRQLYSETSDVYKENSESTSSDVPQNTSVENSAGGRLTISSSAERSALASRYNANSADLQSKSSLYHESKQSNSSVSNSMTDVWPVTASKAQVEKKCRLGIHVMQELNVDDNSYSHNTCFWCYVYVAPHRKRTKLDLDYSDNLFRYQVCNKHFN